MLPISVVIPTYKSKSFFLKNLGDNLTFLKGCQIIIINDDPFDSLKNDLQGFDNVTLIENKRNLGFGQSVNEGVDKAKNKYIMFLNNDVILDDESYKEALEHFKKNPLLFAVSFAQKEKSGNNVGKNKIYWQKGFFNHQKADNLKAGINAWAEGGACLIDKDKYIKLGGFDPVYSPFYWEDIDLSYRAWKHGYTILFEPKILVKHFHELDKSSIRKHFSKNFIKEISFRNQLIFIWKNVTDIKMVLSHFIFILPTIIYPTIKGDFSFIKGFAKALVKIPYILRRRKDMKMIFNSDKIILDKFKFIS